MLNHSLDKSLSHFSPRPNRLQIIKKSSDLNRLLITPFVHYFSIFEDRVIILQL